MSEKDTTQHPAGGEGEAKAQLTADALFDEHQLLGANLSPDERGVLQVDWYGDGVDEPQAFEKGCALADLTNLVGSILSGPQARAFTAMAFCGPVPEPGRIDLSLALAGDGTIVAPVLLAGLGPESFALWCPSECADGLGQWLGALLAIEGDDGVLFPEVTLEEESPFQLTLLLAGPDAASVLGDYLGEGVTLPAPGHMTDIKLDAIPAVVAHLDLGAGTAYLVWVDSSQGRILWRSFLSFEQVVPVGTSAVWGRLAMAAPGIMDFLDEPMAHHSPVDLDLLDLVRDGDDFIGARGLERP